MIDWLEAVFSATSDKARLVTTVIAALIAIIVVLSNQWFNSRRARKEKKIEKIEEMYEVVIKMKNDTYAIVKDINTRVNAKIEKEPYYDEKGNAPKESRKAHVEWLSSFSKAKMLSNLYFKTLESKIIDIEKIYHKFEETAARYTDGDAVSFSYIIMEVFHEMMELLDDVESGLSKIMKETMH